MTGINARNQTQSSSVGLVTNYGKDSSEFFGTFAYQARNQEQVDGNILSDFMEKVFMTLKENKRNKPTNIVVCREGLSEGRYRMPINEEL